MGGDRRYAYNSDRAGDRLTIADAATLLGVHKNTIRNRIKDGTYKAEKVITERGPTYLIERESLLTNLNTNTLSSASQQLVTPQAMEFVQELLRPFVNELGDVREELGAERARRAIERARREVAEERIRDLEAELETLREQARKAPGAPESAAEASEGAAEPRSAAGGPQTLREEPEAAAGEASGMGEEPFPHEEERPQEGLERPWWRRVFGG
jgi:excisionase family DNA binding protein